MPTDTLYGLAADVFNPAAVDRIFEVKDRSETLALPVLVNGWDQVRLVAKDVPQPAGRLAKRFWPWNMAPVRKISRAHAMRTRPKWRRSRKRLSTWTNAPSTFEHYPYSNKIRGRNLSIGPGVGGIIDREQMALVHLGVYLG